MFEYLFENRQLIAIAGKVVDDTEDIVIPVSVVPPPPPDCDQYYNEADCLAHGCYWWGDACHGEPEVPPEEFPWGIVIAAVGGAVVLFGLIFAFKGR